MCFISDDGIATGYEEDTSKESDTSEADNSSRSEEVDYFKRKRRERAPSSTISKVVHATRKDQSWTWADNATDGRHAGEGWR